ncbi:MAG: hypothetical protein ACOY9D_01455 [Pseudomonadota bacterium]
MNIVHLVIPDLFLPEDIAAEACTDLRLPALEKLLGRGRSEILPAIPLENHLCELFGVTCAADAPIAAISAVFDGLAAGCWLRADPVHLRLQRDQLLLLPNAEISADEAGQMCASLNEHFAGQGMEFFAPHPQRWYVRLDALPRIRTTPFSAVLGRNVRGALPTGEDGAHWHQLFNEIQMLLFAHPLNQARAARGVLAVNSVWLWGTGDLPSALQKNYGNISSDDLLVEMFAAAAGVPFAAWPEQWNEDVGDGRQLLVWTGLRSALQRGDLAAWRSALQDFEAGYFQPLWQALRSGKLAQLELDILGEHGMRRVLLKRGDAWAFWRRARRLAEYSLV